MKDFATLILRLTIGTLMAGHGFQKLFGWFDGPGLKGTQGFMQTLGLKPGKIWGTMAALGETFGGVLTFLGFLNPVGPLNIMASMMVAMRRVHWTKGVWNSAGGVEFPLTNFAAAMAIGLAGPGRFSVDGILGLRLNRFVAALSWVGILGIGVAAIVRPQVGETLLAKVQGVRNNPPPICTPEVVVETRPRVDGEVQV